MKTAYLMIGLPGSGKSTVVEDLRIKANEQMQTFGVFSLDSARIGFYTTKCSDASAESSADLYKKAFEFCNAFSKDFNTYVDEVWKSTMKENSVVVVDNTNMTRKGRGRWIQDLRSAKFGGPFLITAVNVMVPVDLAIQRQTTRGDKYVPEQVIRDMHMRYQEVLAPDEVDILINKYGF